MMAPGISSIIQALAPCLPVGCRAVNELVSRALFMDSYEIMKIVYHFMLNLANFPVLWSSFLTSMT